MASRASEASRAIRELLSDGKWHVRSEINAVALPKVEVSVAMRRYFYHHPTQERTAQNDVICRSLGAILVVGAMLTNMAEKSLRGKGLTRRWRLRKSTRRTVASKA